MCNKVLEIYFFFLRVNGIFKMMSFQKETLFLNILLPPVIKVTRFTRRKNIYGKGLGSPAIFERYLIISDFEGWDGVKSGPRGHALLIAQGLS